MKEHYKSLAIKYRPQKIDKVIGQEVLQKTLKHMFHNNTVPQVFIIAGLYGIGKTSTARIIAKTIECENKTSTNDPCNNCHNCQAIISENHPDVLEIDGATSNSVDNVKELIEILNNHPIQGRSKVIIFDEAQMLSNSAWNALLKPFERPPLNTHFIITTTDLKKIPANILSRGMIFYLKSISTEDMIAHAKRILNREEVDYQIEALQLLSENSQGSLRNFLYLLEQAANLGNKKITAEDAQKVVNNTDDYTILSILLFVVSGDKKKIHATIERIFLLGIAAKKILDQLIDAIYICILIKEEIIETPEQHQSTKKTIDEILKKTTLNQLYRMWTILQQQQKLLIYSSNSQKSLFVVLLSLVYSLLSDTFWISTDHDKPAKLGNTDNPEKISFSQKEKNSFPPTANEKPSHHETSKLETPDTPTTASPPQKEKNSFPPTTNEKSPQQNNDNINKLDTEVLELFPGTIIQK